MRSGSAAEERCWVAGSRRRARRHRLHRGCRLLRPRGSPSRPRRRKKIGPESGKMTLDKIMLQSSDFRRVKSHFWHHKQLGHVCKTGVPSGYSISRDTTSPLTCPSRATVKVLPKLYGTFSRRENPIGREGEGRGGKEIAPPELQYSGGSSSSLGSSPLLSVGSAAQ